MRWMTIECRDVEWEEEEEGVDEEGVRGWNE